MSVRSLPKVPKGKRNDAFYDRVSDLEIGQWSRVSMYALKLQDDGTFWVKSDEILLRRSSIWKGILCNLKLERWLLHDVPWPGYKIWRNESGLHVRPNSRLSILQRSGSSFLTLAEPEYVQVNVLRLDRLKIV